MVKRSSTVQLTALGEPFIKCLREAVERSKNHDSRARVTVITPSLYSSFFLRRTLAAYGLFNVDFVRIEDLAELLSGQSLTTKPLSRLYVKELIRASVLDQPVGEFRNIRDHPALIRALHRTFLDLDAAKSDVISKLADLGGRHADLITVWRRYRDRIRGFHDRRAVSLAAQDRLEAEGWPKTRLGTYILLLIAPPVPQYVPLIEALIRLRDGITILGLTGDHVADATVKQMVGDVPQSVDVMLKDSTPRLVRAANSAAEARWIVGNIARITQRDQTRLGNIAVLYSAEHMGRRIEDELALAGIPVSGPNRVSLATYPEGRFVILLMRVFQSDFAREVVTEWLCTAPVTYPDASSRVPFTKWDTVSRLASITKGAAMWRDRLEVFAKRCCRKLEALNQSEGDSDSSRLRAKVLMELELSRDLASFIERIAVNPPPTGRTQWVAYSMWLTDMVDRYMAELVDEPALLRRQQLDDLIRSLSELDGLGTCEPDLERFTAVLMEELLRPARSVHGLGRGVFVAPLREAVGCHFDVVHVIGMTEGSYPAPDDQDVFVPDRLRHHADLYSRYLKTRAERDSERKYQYLVSINSAHKVYLTWPVKGSTNIHGPSRWFIDAARNVSGNARLSSGELDHMPEQLWLTRVPESVVDSLDGVVPEDEYLYDLLSAASWQRSGRVIRDHFLFDEKDNPINAGIELEKSQMSQHWTQFDGNLTSLRIPDVGTVERPIGATTLEQWAACPYRYFLSNLLHLSETERPENLMEISPATRGILVHRILDEFVSSREATREYEASINGEQKIAGIARSVLARFARESAVGHPALWDMYAERLIWDLRKWLSVETDVRVERDVGDTYTEFKFSTGRDGYPPVVIMQDSEKEVVLSGAIDRVEISTDRKNAWVYDYKTGDPSHYELSTEDPVGYGRILQLGVYAAAVRSAFHNLETVDARYWFVFSQSGKKLVPKTWREQSTSTALERALKIIIGNMRSGIYPARPGNPTRRLGKLDSFENCVTCAFDRICPKDKERMWRRKNVDPSLKEYVHLVGGSTGSDDG